MVTVPRAGQVDHPNYCQVLVSDSDAITKQAAIEHLHQARNSGYNTQFDMIFLVQGRISDFNFINPSLEHREANLLLCSAIRSVVTFWVL